MNSDLKGRAAQSLLIAKSDVLMALYDRLGASHPATTRRPLLHDISIEALAPVDLSEMEAAE